MNRNSNELNLTWCSSQSSQGLKHGHEPRFVCNLVSSNSGLSPTILFFHHNLVYNFTTLHMIHHDIQCHLYRFFGILPDVTLLFYQVTDHCRFADVAVLQMQKTCPGKVHRGWRPQWFLQSRLAVRRRSAAQETVRWRDGERRCHCVFGYQVFVGIYSVKLCISKFQF